MSKFEFPTSILSRPVYGVLEARQVLKHLMLRVAEVAGAFLVIATPVLMPKTPIIFIPKALILPINYAL